MDQIPVDVVANAIIVSAQALCKPNKVEVIHVGTSSVNPVTIKSSNEITTAYWHKFAPEKAIAKAKLTFINNTKTFNTIHTIYRKTPAWFYLKFGQMTGNSGVIKNALRYKKVLSREVVIAKSFAHFTNNDWVFSTQKLSNLHKNLRREDQLKFELDIAKLD